MGYKFRGLLGMGKVCMATHSQTCCWRRSWGLHIWIHLLKVLTSISLWGPHLFKPPQRFNCLMNTMVTHLFENIPCVSFPFWSPLRLSFLTGKYKSLLLLKTFVHSINKPSVSSSPVSPCPLLQLIISIWRLHYLWVSKHLEQRCMFIELNYTICGILL